MTQGAGLHQPQLPRDGDLSVQTPHLAVPSCCHAAQDKIWAMDPDGNAWEVFHVHEPDGDRLLVTLLGAVKARPLVAPEDEHDRGDRGCLARSPQEEWIVLCAMTVACNAGDRSYAIYSSTAVI